MLIVQEIHTFLNTIVYFLSSIIYICRYKTVAKKKAKKSLTGGKNSGEDGIPPED